MRSGGWTCLLGIKLGVRSTGRIVDMSASGTSSGQLFGRIDGSRCRHVYLRSRQEEWVRSEARKAEMVRARVGAPVIAIARQAPHLCALRADMIVLLVP